MKFGSGGFLLELPDLCPRRRLRNQTQSRHDAFRMSERNLVTGIFDFNELRMRNHLMQGIGILNWGYDLILVARNDDDGDLNLVVSPAHFFQAVIKTRLVV